MLVDGQLAGWVVAVSPLVNIAYQGVLQHHGRPMISSQLYRDRREAHAWVVDRWREMVAEAVENALLGGKVHLRVRRSLSSFSDEEASNCGLPLKRDDEVVRASTRFAELVTCYGCQQ